MLLVVLALVLAAFGLLVTALATSAMFWAWLSVGASVLAAIMLVVDWSRRRAPVPPAAPPVVTRAGARVGPGANRTPRPNRPRRTPTRPTCSW